MTDLLATRLVVRRATAADAAALADLAALDSSRPLAGDVVLAEADGAVVAAVSGDGRAVADPFVATADVVAMLRLGRAADTRPTRRGLVPAARPRAA
jgi:hypothetical protein